MRSFTLCQPKRLFCHSTPPVERVADLELPHPVHHVVVAVSERYAVHLQDAFAHQVVG
jgi:hypothetical protein